jgi:serine/threonine protein kinase
LQSEPQPLRTINPDIPLPVEEIVMKALSKDPNNRPTAKELAEEFTMVLSQADINGNGTHWH